MIALILQHNHRFYQPWSLKSLLPLSTALTMLLTLSSSPVSAAEGTIWKGLVNGFAIEGRKDHRLTPHLLWYQKNHDYLDRTLSRARPYLYLIIERFRKNRLPLELALLPAVESAFRAYAYSPGSAAGLWQFIPATGKTYGLRQDWWIDERRSILASTDAAIHFLRDMVREFNGDWLLALSAYNAGAGNVRKAIRSYHQEQQKKGHKRQKSNNVDNTAPQFWDLPLPRETQGYVPRILALARFLEQMDHYRYTPPQTPDQPLSREVSTGGRQIDLAIASDLAGIEQQELYQLNPGLNQWATPPDGPHSLLLPMAAADRFETNLASAPPALIEWRRHTVQRNETMSEIALRYHTTAAIIRKQNRKKSNRLRAGEEITIPIPKAPIDSYTYTSSARLKRLQNKSRNGRRLEHTVARGESLWKISKKYGTTTQQLAHWNGMAPGDTLREGKELVVWIRPRPMPELRARPGFVTKMATSTLYYTVKPNDTLSEIATRFHTTVSSIQRLNKLKNGTLIRPGDTLELQIDATRTTQ